MDPAGHRRRIPARMTPGPVAAARLTTHARRPLSAPCIVVEARIIIWIYADPCVDHLSSLFICRCPTDRSLPRKIRTNRRARSLR